jgi:hypothetical protein
VTRAPRHALVLAAETVEIGEQIARDCRRTDRYDPI